MAKTQSQPHAQISATIPLRQQPQRTCGRPRRYDEIVYGAYGREEVAQDFSHTRSTRSNPPHKRVTKAANERKAVRKNHRNIPAKSLARKTTSAIAAPPSRKAAQAVASKLSSNRPRPRPVKVLRATSAVQKDRGEHDGQSLDNASAAKGHAVNDARRATLAGRGTRDIDETNLLVDFTSRGDRTPEQGLSVNNEGLNGISLEAEGGKGEVNPKGTEMGHKVTHTQAHQFKGPLEVTDAPALHDKSGERSKSPDGSLTHSEKDHPLNGNNSSNCGARTSSHDHDDEVHRPSSSRTHDRFANLPKDDGKYIFDVPEEELLTGFEEDEDLNTTANNPSVVTDANLSPWEDAKRRWEASTISTIPAKANAPTIDRKLWEASDRGSHNDFRLHRNDHINNATDESAGRDQDGNLFTAFVFWQDIRACGGPEEATKHDLWAAYAVHKKLCSHGEAGNLGIKLEEWYRRFITNIERQYERVLEKKRARGSGKQEGLGLGANLRPLGQGSAAVIPESQSSASSPTVNLSTATASGPPNVILQSQSSVHPRLPPAARDFGGPSDW